VKHTIQQVTSREDSASGEDEPPKNSPAIDGEEEEDDDEEEEEGDVPDESYGKVHSVGDQLNRQGSHLQAFNQPSGRLTVPVPSLVQASV